ncbi:MAG: hypothetical protein NT062_37615 [Proteobacteria bacterium]|nr:hypothetical protein [Pseudomonadota bacterium]
MVKVLAAGGVVLVGFLVFLMWQLDRSEASPAVESTARTARATAALPGGAVLPTPAAAAAAPAPVDDGKPRKLDPQSDAFFLQFDEMVPKQLTMAAAECYEGAGLNRKTRNQHLKVSFDNVIKDGVVSVANMKMLDGTNLNDSTMEQCMMKKMAGVVWKNDALPDGVWPDQLKITPERGMKKYMKDNMAYQGDGPIGKAVMTSPNQPGLKSDSATRDDHERAEQERVEAGGLPEGMK